MNPDTCTVSEREVLAYVAGDLPESEALALAEHFGDCRLCCTQAAEFTALQGALAASCAYDLVRWHSFATPFGEMFVAATERGLTRLSWRQPDPDGFERDLEARFPDRLIVRDPAALAETEAQLREYFAGERSRFDLPVDLTTLGEFDRRVLETISGLGFGEVIPYAELARRIQKPGAARAVGNALGRNPVAIVLPCHRIVRSDGSLGGYTGGVEYKQRLLALEGRQDLLPAG